MPNSFEYSQGNISWKVQQSSPLYTNIIYNHNIQNHPLDTKKETKNWQPNVKQNHPCPYKSRSTILSPRSLFLLDIRIIGNCYFLNVFLNDQKICTGDSLKPKTKRKSGLKDKLHWYHKYIKLLLAR